MEAEKSKIELLQEIKQLKLQLDLYKSIADYSFDLESLLTPEGKFIYISPSYETITGYPAGLFLEDSGFLVEIALPEYKELVQNHMHEGDNYKPGHFEFQIKTKEGEVKWLEHNCQACYNSLGNLIGYRASNRNITDRKKAQTQLHESTIRNKALLDAIPDLIFVFDSNYQIIDFNAENDDNSLYSKPSDFLNRSIDSLLPENLVTITKLYVDQVLETGIPAHAEYELLIDNRKQQFEARYVQCGNKEVLAIVRNITKSVAAEKELKRESELRRLLVQISTEYMNLPLEKIEPTINNSLERLALFVGADRAYIFSFESETGICVNTHEWCNTEVESLKDKFQRIRLPEKFSEIHKKGGTVRLENVDELPNSYEKTWLVNQQIKSLLVVSMMMNNECIGFVGFDSVNHYNVYTEIEEQILEVFAEMLVTIGNRKQKELELIEAKEHAEESDRLKSAFLENLSHEIRTPMHAICGFVDFLSDEDLTGEKQKNYIRIIQNSATHLLSIVSDILTISSLETNQEKIRMEQVNINNLLISTLEIFKDQAQNSNVTMYIKQQLPDQHAEITTDASKLKQIVNNLISNAFKFTHQGTVEIGYKLIAAPTHERENDGKIAEKLVEFYVKDTGIGIDTAFQPNVFKRFRKAEKNESSQYAGTGLGLAICKGFIELLGGNIWLKSEPGKGSIFYFTLPYHPVYDVKKATPGIGLLSKTVLIAEDEEYNYLYLEEVLNQLGITIFHAKNGEEVLEICNTIMDIDLILMDIKMPIMDGYTAAKILKSKRPELPIIAQSAYALEKEINRYSDVFDDYLTKPINSDVLRELLSKYL